MFSWRLKIREARLALNAGRVDEAGRILQQESVRDFLPAKRLSHEVAQHLVSRAQQHLRQGDSLAGWSDLERAARLGGCDERVAELRQLQTEQGLERIHNLLIRGETKLAAAQIAKLEQHRLGGNQRRAWKLIVHLIDRAKELSDKGQATSGAEMLGRAARLLPPPHVHGKLAHDELVQDELAIMLVARQSELHDRAAKLRQLSTELHDSLARAAWTEVLTTAEAMLELAPAHTAARQARSRAWEAVGMRATQTPVKRGPNRRHPQHNNPPARTPASTHAWTSSAKVDTKAMKREISRRWITWIDGVGGYLICLGDEVLLGQPSGGGDAEIPILADLSRRHASIRREGEAYVITPIHRVCVDGNELTGPFVLKDNALVELGDAVRLRFRKPHALSSTAVLTFESHHKTEPAVDSIVLMSESCVLGPQPQSHIRCRDWPEDLVLFRRGDDLQFRTTANVTLASADEESQSTATSGVVTDTTRIAGDRFALSFEEV